MTTMIRPPSGLEARPVPPLHAGDRLSRAEFERRYAAMPHLKKAELLEGVVYMPPAVSHLFHSGPQFDLIGWLADYRKATPGVVGGDNGTVRLDLDNEPQPDAFLMVRTDHGGQARVDADGYIEGAPELVAEVAASSASYDLHVKLNVYRRNGVREYVVWRAYDAAIDWFVLREGSYEPLTLAPRPGSSGPAVYCSEVFPGLWLDPAALIRGDSIKVAEIVDQGVATPEHAEFVRHLQASSTRK